MGDAGLVALAKCTLSRSVSESVLWMSAGDSSAWGIVEAPKVSLLARVLVGK